MGPKEHWERVYSTKAAESVSWFQPHADLSLRLIGEAGVPLSASIIDVGGGASTLVDDLLARGYSALTVLDLSAAALSATRKRLGGNADQVQWIEASITELELPLHAYDVWHDRAVFHFLTSVEDRRAYVQNSLRAIKPGGHLVIATFADNGPSKCSGLAVRRYSAADLQAEFGESFALIRHEHEVHRTPSGVEQHFTYCHFRHAGEAPAP